MHDPQFLLYDARLIRLDVWHCEPGGHDSGDICGHPPNRGLGRLVWTVRHAGHLRLRWWPYFKVKRWIVDRCDGCGKRFRFRRDARHSYQSSDKVWHEVCMSLRHVRSQLDDFIAYARGEGDSNARWRVEYRLRQLDEASNAEAPDGR